MKSYELKKLRAEKVEDACRCIDSNIELYNSEISNYESRLSNCIDEDENKTYYSDQLEHYKTLISICEDLINHIVKF